MPSIDPSKISVRFTTLLGVALTILAATIVLGAATGALAADPVEMTVIDRETNQPLDLFSHDGRLFIAGQTGSRYALRVRNNTGRRVMVAIAVDGVNIITGETAANNQMGYIFGPGESYDLTGWRKSQEEVAAFVFAPLPKSYAALTGRPSEVGVIGFAVFDERVPPPVATINLRNLGSGRTLLQLNGQRLSDDPNISAGSAVTSGSRQNADAVPAEVLAQVELETRGNPSMEDIIRDLSEAGNVQSQSARGSNSGGYNAPAAPVVQRQPERLGTGHGDLERSRMTYVNFERASATPAFATQIRYDSRDNLIAAGVVPAGFTPPRFTPDPPLAR